MSPPFWSVRADPKFGDYQSNALMSLAKARKMNPRQLATDVARQARRFRRLRKSGNRRRGLPEFPAEKFRRSRKHWKPPRAASICFSTKPRRRKRSSLISVRRTSPSRCTSATSAPPASATRSSARCGCSAIASSATTTSATGARSSANCCSAGNRILNR